MLIVPGTGGLIDFDAVLRVLRQHGFDEPVAVEMAPGDTAEAISASFVEARTFVDGVLRERNAVPSLKRMRGAAL